MDDRKNPVARLGERGFLFPLRGNRVIWRSRYLGQELELGKLP